MPGTHRFGRWTAVAALTLAVATAAPACAATGVASGYRPTDQQQSGTCDGVAAPQPGNLQLLDGSAEVRSAVLCTNEARYVPGQGVWRFALVLPLPTDRVPELVAALRQPDRSGESGGSCTASLIVVPDFVLTLADGSQIRPGVPGDGCHPLAGSLAAFDVRPAIKPSTTTRTTRVFTELEVTTGCGPGAKSPAVWLDAKAGTGPRPVVLPAGGQLSLCRYHGTGDQEGELTAAAISTASGLRPLWTAVYDVSGTPPAGCASSGDPMQSPAVDWLTIQQAPRPPYRADSPGATPLALLELGGCRRLVTPAHGLIGYATRAAVDRLAAVANRPDN